MRARTSVAMTSLSGWRRPLTTLSRCPQADHAARCRYLHPDWVRSWREILDVLAKPIELFGRLLACLAGALSIFFVTCFSSIGSDDPAGAPLAAWPSPGTFAKVFRPANAGNIRTAQHQCRVPLPSLSMPSAIPVSWCSAASLLIKSGDATRAQYDRFGGVGISMTGQSKSPAR